MKKLIYSFALLFSLSLHAQDALELDDENMEVNPNESVETSSTPDTAVTSDEGVNTAPIEEFADDTVEPVTAVEEKKEEAAATEKPEEKVAEEKKEEPIETDEEAVPEVVAKPEEAAKPVINTEPEPYKASISDPGTPALISSEDVEYENSKFKQYKSHWVTTFGFQQLTYEAIPEGYNFEGRKDFNEGDTQELWGGRLGFGGEIYLGAGFMTRSMVEGYYAGTLFSRVLNGGDEEGDEDFAFTKRTGQVFGVDATQSLGWIFDFKTKNPFMDEWSYLTVEPFVEAGIGQGFAYNRVNYAWDTSPAPTGSKESFRLRVRDNLLNARVAAGINLTANSGFFLQLKATVNRYEITKRKVDGFNQPNGQASDPINDSPKDAKIDPVVSYFLGGGYKF